MIQALKPAHGIPSLMNLNSRTALATLHTGAHAHPCTHARVPFHERH